MSASLVGSEMCIRDRANGAAGNGTLLEVVVPEQATTDKAGRVVEATADLWSWSLSHTGALQDVLFDVT
eukprot:8105973-Alexandrium_andersonii.AAC.1